MKGIDLFIVSSIAAMSSVSRANAKVKTCVITSSSVFFTLQVISLAASVAFYLLASSDKYRDELAETVITALYPRHQWLWLRRERALEFHILLACGIQLLLVLPTILLLIGASRRIRALMLPFLVLFGLAQLLIMASIVACVIYLPVEFKPLAMAITVIEAAVFFPWWFCVIHLFAIFDRNHFHGPYLVYPQNTATYSSYSQTI